MRVTSLEPEGTASRTKCHKTRPTLTLPTERSSAEARVSASTGENSGSRSTIAIGKKARVTTGPVKGLVGTVIAEYVPLKPKAWRVWVLKTDDLVGRREIRHDYLEGIE